jgi:D-aminopeptidase
MSESVYYVYCIAESSAVAQLSADSLPAAIEEDAQLEWIVVSTLAALASRVPKITYSEEQLTEHLTDATWTAIRAMRHETVVEYVAKRVTTIPLRFATIYLERDGIEEMLTEQARDHQMIIEQ